VYNRQTALFSPNGALMKRKTANTVQETCFMVSYVGNIISILERVTGAQ
jgi:hypothetical protein